VRQVSNAPAAITVRLSSNGQPGRPSYPLRPSRASVTGPNVAPLAAPKHRRRHDPFEDADVERLRQVVERALLRGGPESLVFVHRRHDLGDDGFRRSSFSHQPLGHADAILRGPVLAHLPP